MSRKAVAWLVVQKYQDEHGVHVQHKSTFYYKYKMEAYVKEKLAEAESVNIAVKVTITPLYMDKEHVMVRTT